MYQETINKILYSCDILYGAVFIDNCVLGTISLGHVGLFMIMSHRTVKEKLLRCNPTVIFMRYNNKVNKFKGKGDS